MGNRSWCTQIQAARVRIIRFSNRGRRNDALRTGAPERQCLELRWIARGEVQDGPDESETGPGIHRAIDYRLGPHRAESGRRRAAKVQALVDGPR
jgi:hypothetical protein